MAEDTLTARLNAKAPVNLRVKELSVSYQTSKGWFRAVDRISFDLPAGSNLGLVGESGCGKSTVIKALMRLTPDDAAVTGEVVLDGIDILQLTERELQKVRWTKVALITQSAMNSLDPVWTVGDQIVESILAHEKVRYAEAWKRAEKLFDIVGLPPARLSEYPHQFSGGMRQRAVIAMALSLNAGLLLADEPTTALDPIMQDQVMAKLHAIQSSFHRSMILVTHDIAVVSETCERLAVMYAGQIIETGMTADVLRAPRHPYTMGLKNAFPRMLDNASERPPLISISGGLPSLLSPPPGCRFASRCPFAQDRCLKEAPQMRPAGEGRSAACHFVDQADGFAAAAQRPETWTLQESPA